MLRNLLKKYTELDTLEKKSFWAVAPLVAVTGIAAIILTANFFDSPLILVFAGAVTAFPVAMMIICIKTKDYHFCYPMLCAGVGGLLMPLAFLTNGAFDSGMPMYCLCATVICTFCYEKHSRISTFAISFIMTMMAFLYSKSGFGTLFPLASYDAIVEDIIIAYVILSFGIFIVINMLLVEARNYVSDSEVLSGYVDKSIKKQLIEHANSGTISNTGVHKKVTVLFADISRFTTTTERMEPEMAADYLNTFLAICDDCIHDNEGIIDKYIGDCVMAYWVDPDDNYSGIIRAVKTVLEVRSKLYERSADIFKQFGTEMDFTAGIEYGEVVLGNIGSANRKDYTIIGDAVNTSNRLQSCAARGELILSGNAVEKVKDALMIQGDPQKIFLKGKNNPIEIYRVVGLNEGAEVLLGLSKKQNIRMTFLNRTSLNSSDKEGEGYKMYVCGCRGSFPVSGLRYSEFGGETSCYVIRKNDYALILDCGSGMMNAAEILKGCKKIDILLTHVHYDHILGLLNISVIPKDAEINMYGHFGSWIGDDTIRNFMDTPYWPVSLPDIPMNDVVLGREVELSEKISASFYRAFHPDNGCVIKLMVGSSKICLYSDLEDPHYMNPEIARDSDVLIYDGMFDKTDPVKHVGWGHSTWQDGVEYAKRENVRRLIITHHSPDSTDQVLRQREHYAKEQLDQTLFARIGDVYTF